MSNSTLRSVTRMVSDLPAAGAVGRALAVGRDESSAGPASVSCRASYRSAPCQTSPPSCLASLPRHAAPRIDGQRRRRTCSSTIADSSRKWPRWTLCRQASDRHASRRARKLLRESSSGAAVGGRARTSATGCRRPRRCDRALPDLSLLQIAALGARPDRAALGACSDGRRLGDGGDLAGRRRVRVARAFAAPAAGDERHFDPLRSRLRCFRLDRPWRDHRDTRRGQDGRCHGSGAMASCFFGSWDRRPWQPRRPPQHARLAQAVGRRGGDSRSQISDKRHDASAAPAPRDHWLARGILLNATSVALPLPLRRPAAGAQS